MGPIKEWCCIEHGDFEGTHPICPAMGCDSGEVTRVFLTPPMISKGKFKRFEASTRATSEMMGIRNFRSSKEGDVSFAGRGTDAPPGMEVLWGPQQVEKVMGHSMPDLMRAAQRPLAGPQGTVYKRNNAVNELATDNGLTSRTLARAGEVTSADKQERSKATALTQ